MGHVHFRVLPGTKKWRDVVGLIDQRASDGAIIAASAKAAERDLLGASDDRIYVECVRLLLSIPHAARNEDFGAALRSADLPVPKNPGLFDLLTAITVRTEEIARDAGRRTDLGEIARRALTRTITECIGDQLPGLFGATPGDVQEIARKLSYSKGIAVFSRSFFGNVVGGTLSYWLDRTLASHIGPDGRFPSVAGRAAFDGALCQFTAEATRIIQEFAGGWYGKTLHERGAIDAHSAKIFGAVALKKIVEELRHKGTGDA